jgi:hypothetical protein
MLNLFFLLASCGIAVVRPLWGFGLYFLFEHTLFWLGLRYTVVGLPIGAASAADALPLAILAGALATRRSRQSATAQMPFASLATRTLTGAAVPFFAWVIGCFVISALDAHGRQPLSVFLRHALSFTIPWVLVAAVWILRAQSRVIATMAVAAAVATSCTHLIIMGLNLRSLFPAAYYGPDLWSEEVEKRGFRAAHEFIRFYPAGIYLMICVAAFLIGLSVISQNRRALRTACLAAIVSAGIWISFMRSAQAAIVFAMFAAVSTAFLIVRSPSRVTGRVLRTVTVAALAIAGIFAVNPQAMDYLLRRYVSAPSEAQGLFNPSNPRGLNNIAAMQSLMESPLAGHGGNYLGANSVGNENEMHDVHGLLQIALYGGIVGLLLLLRGLAILVIIPVTLLRRWRAIALEPQYAASAAVAVTTYVFFSLLGYTSVLIDRGGAAFGIFIGLLAAELHNVRCRGVQPSVARKQVAPRKRNWIGMNLEPVFNSAITPDHPRPSA